MSWGKGKKDAHMATGLRRVPMSSMKSLRPATVIVGGRTLYGWDVGEEG
eukprot:CAMPEP_0185182262 /NCGR_PEP_ID=MMETSP1140-20130426/1227_1 /TAXON_ID=298111 /ORGANISM="Pavlova sp., Strain CCMP459" /LENGTH=48 /DNA_ID= /DNA_START= /DNA_END= /DNA_ORIENTATION=